MRGALERCDRLRILAGADEGLGQVVGLGSGSLVVAVALGSLEGRARGFDRLAGLGVAEVAAASHDRGVNDRGREAAA